MEAHSATASRLRLKEPAEDDGGYTPYGRISLGRLAVDYAEQPENMPKRIGLKGPNLADLYYLCSSLINLK